MPTPSGFEPQNPQRLAALRAYAILDTPPEREFDEIAEMAAQACGTPMAHINFVDADRQWIKAAFGHAARAMPLDFGFCTEAHARGRHPDSAGSHGGPRRAPPIPS